MASSNKCCLPCPTQAGSVQLPVFTEDSQHLPAATNFTEPAAAPGPLNSTDGLARGQHNFLNFYLFGLCLHGTWAGL